jgi:amino acid transporter
MALMLIELISSVLAVIAGIIAVVGTFVSSNAFSDVCKQSSGSCVLFADWTKTDRCPAKGVCDGVIFSGLTVMAVGLLFILQTMCVLCVERKSTSGNLSRLRCLAFPKLLLAAVSVLTLLGIAIMVSAGVGVYCDHVESFWKHLTNEKYLGCKHMDEAFADRIKLPWPKNGFMTLEVTLGGVWMSFGFWVLIMVINIIQYRRRGRKQEYSFKEMPDKASAAKTDSS